MSYFKFLLPTSLPLLVGLGKEKQTIPPVYMNWWGGDEITGGGAVFLELWQTCACLLGCGVDLLSRCEQNVNSQDPGIMSVMTPTSYFSYVVPELWNL